MLVAILICFFAPLPPPPSSTLFPYTTLFRSQQRIDQQTDLNISITVTTAEGETISAGDDPGPGATEARTQGSGSEVITVFIPQSDVRAHTASAWVLISVAGLSALSIGVSVADRKSTRLNSSHVATSY